MQHSHLYKQLEEKRQDRKQIKFIAYALGLWTLFVIVRTLIAIIIK